VRDAARVQQHNAEVLPDDLIQLLRRDEARMALFGAP
jgi:hypothetical protein